MAAPVVAETKKLEIQQPLGIYKSAFKEASKQKTKKKQTKGVEQP
jgi:hypothetical protein